MYVCEIDKEKKHREKKKKRCDEVYSMSIKKKTASRPQAHREGGQKKEVREFRKKKKKKGVRSPSRAALR